MLKFVCVALLVAVASAQDSVHFTDCGHHEVTKLIVSQCAGADICTIHKGKPLKFEAEIVSNQDSAHIELKLTATVSGLTIPVPGAEKDGCKYVKCPIVKGEKVDFLYNLTVPKLLPDIRADVEAHLVGDKGLLACIKVKGQIAD